MCTILGAAHICENWGDEVSGPVLSGGSFKGTMYGNLEGAGPEEDDPLVI